MKVKAKAGVLAKLLAIVTRAVPAKRPSVPLLSAVLIEAQKTENGAGVLKMSATDMEISIALGARAPVEEEGSVAVPARVLLDILKSLPDEEVLLASDGKTASVSRGKNAYELVAHDKPEEFPKLPAFPSPDASRNGSTDASPQAPAEEDTEEPDAEAETGVQGAPDGKAEADTRTETVFTVPTAQLVAATKSVFPAVSSNDQQPVLTGVFFSFDEGRATMAATDGYRLAVNEAKLEGSVGSAGTALIPGRALKELVKLCELGEEAVVALTENAAIFSVRGVVLSTRLIDGNYPAYQKLLPEASEQEFSVEAESLKGALRRVSLIAGRENPTAPVHLSFSRSASPEEPEEPGLLGEDPGESPGETADRPQGGGELTITVRGAVAGRATETVAADVPEGAGFASCFNPLHLLEGAEVIETEKIRFLVNEPQKPILMSGLANAAANAAAKPEGGIKNGEDRPGGFLYLAMPRRDPEAKAKAKSQSSATVHSEETAGPKEPKEEAG